MQLQSHSTPSRGTATLHHDCNTSAHRQHLLLHPIGGRISCGTILPPIGGLHLHGDYTDIRRQPDDHTGGRVFWHQTLYKHFWMRTGWKGMIDFLCLDWIWVNNGNRDSERVVLSVTTRSCTTTSMSRWCEAYLWSHLWRDSWCSQDLPWKCTSFQPLSSIPPDSLFLQVIHDLVTCTEHAKQKMVTALDVVYTLKWSGRTLYSFSA